MKPHDFYLGIDVSKDTFNACLINQAGETIEEAVFKNLLDELDEFWLWIKDHVSPRPTPKVMACMEDTGLYCLTLMAFFEKKNIKYACPSAMQIKLNGQVQKGKSDKVDAWRIADYAKRYHDQLKPYKVRSNKLLKLQALVKFRNQMVKKKTALQNMKDSFSLLDISSLEKFQQQALKQTRALIAKIEKEISTLIKSVESMKKNYDLITSVPGVGPILAWNFIMTTWNFSRFDLDPKRYASYVAVVPYEDSSGSSRKMPRRISKIGNSDMKSKLHFGAMSAIRHDVEIQQYYKKKKKEGKHDWLVKNNIKNKLIARVFAVVRRQESFFNKFPNQQPAKGF